MSNQKNLNQLLIFVNLYQRTKNEAISSICSSRIVFLKILQSDWLRAFWPISQEQDISQIRDLCRNTANNRSLHDRENTVKINDQNFFKLKNPIFHLLLAHFSNFGSKKSFFEKSTSVTRNFTKVSSTMLIFRKK